MSKDAYYYPHDSNMWNDPKIIAVRRKHGISGYGLVNRLNELLRDDKNNRLGLDEDSLDDIIFDIHDPLINRDVLEDIILHFRLYEREDPDENNETGYFYSKRMRRNIEKMNEIKQKRSLAGQKSGKIRQKINTSLTNDEHLINNKRKVKESKRKEKENKINISFDSVWDLYDYKIGTKEKLRKKWESLTDIERESIIEHIPLYKISTPDKQFRKHFSTYLNNRAWEDEILNNTNGIDKFKRDSTGFPMAYCEKCGISASYKEEELNGQSRCCQAKLLSEKKVLS